MKATAFRRGDLVVFRKTKQGLRPGPRARGIHPHAQGDTYCYHVDKYWVVTETQNHAQIVVVTRRGKQHVLDADTPCLRRAYWWERLFLRERFPAAESLPTEGLPFENWPAEQQPV